MNNSNNLARTIDNLLNPKSIAIVGASESPLSFGLQYMDFVYNFGFKGKVYPVTPKAKEIMGLRTYSQLRDIPEDIDYVISCVNSTLVMDLLEQSFEKNVKVIHLLTARFSETGNADAKNLEEKIFNKAKKLGIRLIGPNCMGVYYPKLRISFNYDLPTKSGPVGAIFQSGGLGGDLVRHASLRGVYFSKVISYGNAIDLNECDFLEYFLWDKNTKCIAMYLEGIRDGRRFLDILSRTTKSKPVIVLAGGRSKAGSKSVASHTASIASSTNTLEVALKQCGAIQVYNMNELIDVITAFTFIPPFTGKNTGIIGGGGGKSVLAADECEEAGLNVIPMPRSVRDYIDSGNPEMTGWMDNPVDFSILAGYNIDANVLLTKMAEDPEFDILIGNVTEDAPMNQMIWTGIVTSSVEGFIKIKKQNLCPIIIILSNPEIDYNKIDNWRWETVLKMKSCLTEEEVPVYPEAKRAANAINKFIDYYSNIKD